MFAGVRRSKDLTLYRHLAASGEHGTDVAYSSWVSIVRAYTASQLSVPSDNMVAILAGVKMMGHISSDKYVVGMWYKHLHCELFWSLT